MLHFDPCQPTEYISQLSLVMGPSGAILWETEKRVDGNNPFVKDAMDMRLNLVAQGHVSVPTKKGNVQAEKRKQDMDVDSSPLPSRKTNRKSK